MKHLTQNLLVSGLLGIFLISLCQSCQREEFTAASTSLRLETEMEKKTQSISIDIPFFQDSFVQEALNIQPRWEGIIPDLIPLKDELIQIYLAGSELNQIESSGKYPAWSLAEPYFLEEGFINFYVPFYDLASQEIAAIMVSRYEDSAPRFYYLDRALVDQIHANNGNPFTEYWTSIFDYYSGELSNDRFGVTIGEMPKSRCIVASNGMCACIGTVAVCDLPPCGDFTCPGGDPNDNGDDPVSDPAGDGDDPNDPKTFTNEHVPDYNTGIVIPGNGNPPPNVYCHELEAGNLPTHPFNFTYTQVYGESTLFCSTWDDYIKGFDCNGEVGWEDWPPNDPNDNGGDGGSGGMGKLDIVMTTGSLFKLQLNIIIDRQGLNMTAEELRDFLGSNCNLTRFKDLKNWVNWNLIEDLSTQFHMTDKNKWCLFENPEQIEALKNAVASGSQTGLSGCVLEIFLCERNFETLEVWYKWSGEEAQELMGYPTNCDCSDVGSIFLSCLSEKLFDDLNNKIDLSPYENCLKGDVDNLVHLDAINDFLKKHEGGTSGTCSENSEYNLAKAVATAYAGVLCEEGITELDMGDVGDPNDPIWEFMKEALLESAKEILADVIPGGTLATLGPELFDNLQSGNFMDAMYNALDIVLNEADVCFPALKIISASSTAVWTAKLLTKAHEGFKKAKSLGQEFVGKLLNIFENRLNWDIKTIRNKFQSGKGIGAKIDDVTGSSFFQHIQDEFNAIDVGFVDPRSGNAVFKLLELPAGNSIYATWYPVSSEGFYTISFLTGPSNANAFSQLIDKFKLRFDQ